MQPGAGPGLTPRNLGDQVGEQEVALASSELPSHSHSVRATGLTGDMTSPLNNVPAAGNEVYSQNGTNLVQTAPSEFAGGGRGHNNMQPYLVFNFCIALEGVFPRRS